MRQVMDRSDIARVLTRIAHEILERNRGGEDLVLLGIHTRGVPLAHRIGAALEAIEGRSVPVGSLDIGLYRDDLDSRPTRSLGPTDVPVTIDGQTVVFVDDVLFTGRTIRAALDALTDLGRAGSVQLVSLVDRGHRELPIRADYIGKNLPTSLRERVAVRLADIDDDEGVWIEERFEGTGTEV